MKKSLLAIASVAILTIAPLAPLTAQAETYYGHSYYSYRHHHPVKAYFNRHPYQKKALIGGGIGAAGGLLLGGRSGLVKGALIGGAAGTGYEYWKKHR